jgi:DNA topoisomerase I
MPTSALAPRLKKVDCSGPGLRRVRRGRGFAITPAMEPPGGEEIAAELAEAA